MDPIVFTPLYQTRVWGGRTLSERYQRPLPDGQPYGESWEICDRESEQSIVSEGPFAGMSLHELWTKHREEIFGDQLLGERFPLLIKILDARDDLSIQVHPPQEVAHSLGGEPKTEMWFIADCDPSAKLYIGLKEGCTRESFQASLDSGTVESQVHSVTPKAGESIFIPSGRLHAIGAGFLIYEIQQNSDTTYRVFDWNRKGLDGQARDLHIEQSMVSIDFDDIEPAMDQPDGKTLASCPHFVVDQLELQEGETLTSINDRFSIITIVSGQVITPSGRSFAQGDFFLLARSSPALRVTEASKILQTYLPL